MPPAATVAAARATARVPPLSLPVYIISCIFSRPTSCRRSAADLDGDLDAYFAGKDGGGGGGGDGEEAASKPKGGKGKGKGKPATAESLDADLDSYFAAKVCAPGSAHAWPARTRWRFARRARRNVASACSRPTPPLSSRRAQKGDEE